MANYDNKIVRGSALESILKSLKGYIDGGLGAKQDKIVAGTGLALASDGKTLSVTLDTTLYKVVTTKPTGSAPAEGEENKILIVKNTQDTGDNLYTEYIWVNTGSADQASWHLETLGEFKTDFTLNAASTTSYGGIKLDTNDAITVGTKVYPVQLTSEGKAYVSVPWTDTDNDTKYTGDSTYITISEQNVISINETNVVTANKLSESVSAINEALGKKADKTEALKSVSVTTGGETLTLTPVSGDATTVAIPKASATTYGFVKSSTTGTTAGKDYNVEVNADGTMKVNVPWTDTKLSKDDVLSYVSAADYITKSYVSGLVSDVKLNGVTLSYTTYDGESHNVGTLPAATATTYGVIKVGANLNISSEGVLSAVAPDEFTLTAATDDSLGGIMLGFTQAGKSYPVELSSDNTAYVTVDWQNTEYTKGTGIEISSSNVISVDSTIATKSYVSDEIEKLEIGNYVTQAYLSSQSYVQSASRASKEDYGLVKVGTNLKVTDGVVDYELPTATNTVLGGVKVPTGDTAYITISNGVINVDTTKIATQSYVNTYVSSYVNANCITTEEAEDLYKSVFEPAQQPV